MTEPMTELPPVPDVDVPRDAPPAHALSPAEIQNVLDRAVEEKRREMGLDAESVKARREAADALAARKRDLAAQEAADEAKRALESRQQEPDRWVGLDSSASGTYGYTKVPVALRQHRLTVDGVGYEHVATDAEGIWLYRYMP